jgi:hypothetical protein
MYYQSSVWAKHLFTFVDRESGSTSKHTSSSNPSTAPTPTNRSFAKAKARNVPYRRDKNNEAREERWHASSCWCYYWQCPPSMLLRIMVRSSVIDEEQEELTSLFYRRSQDRCRQPPPLLDATPVDCTNDDGTLTKDRVRGVSNATLKFGMVAWRRYVAWP